MKNSHLLFVVLALLASFVSGCSTVERQPQRKSGVTQVAYVETVLPASEVRGADPYRYPSDAPQIYAQSWILIDARSGETLAYRNPDQRRPVASTQKLLTGLLIAEQGGLEQIVTVKDSDTRVEPSKLGIRPGERYRRRDLLGVMMVKSSNDAAACLARDYAGSEAAFANMMTQRAAQLGARNSRFANAHGLPAAGQYSTARDMARIAFYAYRNRTLRDLMARRSYTIQLGNRGTVTLETTNKLLGRVPYINGMKTGYTQASGRCLVTSASVPGGPELILVQLGSNTKNIFRDAARVMEWGANEYRHRLSRQAQPMLSNAGMRP
jgi:D-alanyl-D-alanine carboxypeptidase (penicillin-binding protein 5/6)